MSRSWLSKVVAVALGLCLPACRSGQGPSTAGPSAPAPPAEVQQLVGQTRILRHRGNERKVTLKREDLARLGGGCDAAVDVRQASLEGGTLRLNLSHVGRPNMPSKARARVACAPVPDTVVAVTRVGSADAFSSTIDTLLPTPEQYLKASGTPFERDKGPAPAVAAADGPGTTGEERALSYQVKTWPVALLTVDADVPAGKQVGGRESEIDFVGVVGTDGRLHGPKVVTPLAEDHVKQLMRAFEIWRYQPARSATAEVPARVNGKAVLRLY